MKKITLIASMLIVSIASSDLKAQSAETIDVVSPNVVTTEIPEIGTERGANTLIFDNGTHFNVAGNPDLSVTENVTLGLTTFGLAVATASGFSIADDFTLDADFDITSVDLYGYQTGAPTTPPTINTVVIQIWDGDPSDPASSVIYGDLTTNLFDEAAFSNTFRVLEDDQASTARAIYRVTALTPDLSLPAGTYWIEWQYGGDPAFSGPWQPPVVRGLGILPSGNALQSNAGVFGPALDGGNGSNFDFPFQIFGDESLSIDDNQLSNQITLLPNPAITSITITNATSNLNRIEIYNIDGKLIGNTRVNVTSTTVDISNLANGIYLVKIYTDQGTITKKLLKA